jgi:hypothetical protein
LFDGYGQLEAVLSFFDPRTGGPDAAKGIVA